MLGYADREIAQITGFTEKEIRKKRKDFGIKPVFKGVDTCAGEFVAYTPYYYSSYEMPFFELNGKVCYDED